MSHYDNQRHEQIVRDLNDVTVAEVMKIPKAKDVYDNVDKPKHYNVHPSGIECIQVTEHMSFCIGNAIKYMWRAGIKSKNAIEDLEKAIWYINREIKRIKNDY